MALATVGGVDTPGTTDEGQTADVKAETRPFAARNGAKSSDEIVMAGIGRKPGERRGGRQLARTHAEAGKLKVVWK